MKPRIDVVSMRYIAWRTTNVRHDGMLGER